jgi:hypothetical protein
MVKIGPLNIAETRDIRPDLRARLETAIASRDRAREHLNFFDSEVNALTRLLALEDRRFSETIGTVEDKQPFLTGFIIERLKKRRMSKDELRVVAAEAGFEIDGRSIHATLVNLVRTGKVRLEEGGFYFAG